ncbi:hypothetical protein ACFWEV_34830 [Streptomyces bacillaris]|uniref:hypothetical protein n=1 Tax=Streptomyces bacillaris TaxID=68179 RepID=UPI003664AA08
MAIPPLHQHPTAARRRCTGESHQALQTLPPADQAPEFIPAASSTVQARFESDIALRAASIGGISPHPLGIVALHPTPDRLTLRLLNEPYVISHWAQTLLPTTDPDTSPPVDAVSGVAGLRYRLGANTVHLHRPGTPARVDLTGFNPRWWQRVARSLTELHLDTAAFTRPDWTDAEHAIHDHVAGRPHDPRIGSALLRRIRATAGPGRANGTDLWTTSLGGIQWTLETTDGPLCTDILPLLSQPPTGPGWQLTAHQCRCPHGGDFSCTAYLDAGAGQTVYYTNLHWGRTEPRHQFAELNRTAFRFLP